MPLYVCTLFKKSDIFFMKLVISIFNLSNVIFFVPYHHFGPLYVTYTDFDENVLSTETTTRKIKTSVYKKNLAQHEELKYNEENKKYQYHFYTRTHR